MIKTNKFRDLEKKNFLIKEVYNRYRKSNFVQGKKADFFIEFPYSDDEVLINGTDRIEEVKQLGLEGKTIFRKKGFEDGKYVYRKVVNDGNFFKNTSKVFDMVIELEKEAEIEHYKYPDGNVKELTKEVLVTEIGAGKIKDMIAALCDEEPEMKEDGSGYIYDYEDKMKNLLKGKFMKFKAIGFLKDTKYTYSKGEEFKTLDSIFEAPKSKEIDISDLPF